MQPKTLPVAFFLLATFLVVAPARGAEPPPAPTLPPEFVPRQVILQWAPGVERADKVDARVEAEVGFQANLGDPDFQLVEVESGQTVAAAIDELERNPAVVIAERDSYSAPTSVPNDPLFGQEWGLANLGTGINGFAGAVAGDDIDVTGAWTKTVGTPSTVVADIDTGYRFDSPDLGPVAWQNPGEIAGNGIDDDGNGFVDDIHGYDFVGPNSESPSQDANPTDDNLISGGHGVHTAGTIGAAGNNNVGITGVAQNVRIMPLRVCANAPALSEARCPTSSTIAAINYAGANGARVANMSLGGTTNSVAELDAFAENPQTLYVIAAGNDGQNNDSVAHYPCNFEPRSTGIAGAVENIVCVAATNQADGLASFSDWGEENVDLGAPGTEILSTYPVAETRFEEGFEVNDFATKWTATGVDGGLARTNEAPLTSFGISDSPEATPVANSGHSSTLSSPIALPAGYGACQFSGQDFVSLGGGSTTLIIFKNGLSAFTFQLPNTGGTAMKSFATAPMTGLAESTVGVRLRYTAGPSPTASSGAWFDDLKLTCNAPLSTPPGYAYLQGTSMAAPHVSGTAALLFSLQSTASVASVRHALLGSVDPVPSLAGKSATGGRLDAAKALADLDVDVPAAPALNASKPASPGNTTEPRLRGTAETGSTVELYFGAGCKFFPFASGSAAEFSSSGIEAEASADSSNEFSARVSDIWGDLSPCSAPFTYVEDEQAPPAPVMNEIIPNSPSNDNEPRILGFDAEETTVHIYAGGSCGGTMVASGSNSALSSIAGIKVAVLDDSSNEFTANAEDAAHNTSICSTPIIYVEDSTAPAAPVLSGTDPPSPGSSAEPAILGSAEAGSTVRIYGGGACQGSALEQGGAAELELGGIEVFVAQGLTRQFTVDATDAADNRSTCSAPISYTNSSPHEVVEFHPTVDPNPTTEPPLPCKVPKLAGLSLAKAKSALSGAGCALGKVTKPKPKKGKKLGALVVKSSTPGAGASTTGTVALKLGPKPKKRSH